jgi:ligand-binding SRPBCC domain-containing protein
MVKIEESILIDRPVEEVWKFKTDPSNGPKYNPDIVEVRQVSSGPFGVGTTFRMIRAKTPKVLDLRVIKHQLNSEFTAEVISGPIKGSTLGSSFGTVEGKTRLTETYDFKFSGLYKLGVLFVGGTAKREVATLLGNIKLMLESKAKS